MTNIINLPWISRNLYVTDSCDSTLIGISGTVLNETKRTISIHSDNKELNLAKNVIKFTIDDNEEIDGLSVSQRPEDRINRKYRRN
ncbi:MAG: ribonuclease P protein subunit [Candidatus Thalassarchaeaceae archaeon]|nr:ribonuclease P protein subunit [Candidatus Thalassarchaeaceae archaeon]